MTDTPLPDSSNASADPGGGSIFGPVQLTRAMILIVGIAFAMIFYYAARWLPWPDEPGFRGSMGQAKALGAFLVAIALLVACTIIGTFIVGRRWFLAGLMAATAGLATWSVRGGTMTAVLFNAQNTGANQAVFLQMLGELIVFFGVIAALWNLIWIMACGMTPVATSASQLESHSQAARVKNAARVLSLFSVWGHALSQYADETSRKDEGRSTGAGLLAQTAIMAILMLLLVVTPMKKQVLTSVFVSSVISTALAEFFFADRKAGRWYWVAPLVVGAFGYLAGYFSPAGLDTGNLQGTFSPLARVLPLDYASMGCAGALFGYWWMEPDASAEGPVSGIEGDIPGKSPNAATETA